MAEFSIEDLEEVFTAFPEGSDPVLVGGQALNFWATRYAGDHPEILNLQPFTSSDLDVLNSDEDADAVARHLGYEIRKPAPGHYTPERAKIAKRFDDPDALVVDFMWDLWRLNPGDVKAWAVPSRTPGIGRVIRVMHPMHCFISRIENHFSALAEPPIWPPEGSRALRRCRLALDVLEAYLAERAVSSSKEIYKVAEILGRSATEPNQLLAWRTYEIDGLLALPTAGSLATEYLDTRLPQLKDEAARQRNRHREA
jgi:hypothetical protein